MEQQRRKSHSIPSAVSRGLPLEVVVMLCLPLQLQLLLNLQLLWLRLLRLVMVVWFFISHLLMSQGRTLLQLPSPRHNNPTWETTRRGLSTRRRPAG